MTEDRAPEILAAIHVVDTNVAVLTERVDVLRTEDTRAADTLKVHGMRLDKLERIAYVALGIAIASGVPQLANLIP